MSKYLPVLILNTLIFSQIKEENFLNCKQFPTQVQFIDTVNKNDFSAISFKKLMKSMRINSKDYITYVSFAENFRNDKLDIYELENDSLTKMSTLDSINTNLSTAQSNKAFLIKKKNLKNSYILHFRNQNKCIRINNSKNYHFILLYWIDEKYWILRYSNYYFLGY